MAIDRVVHVKGQPIVVTQGAGSLWVLTQQPSRIYRVDPKTARILGQPLTAPQQATALTFGSGSLWVDAPNANALVRLDPSSPSPAPAPAETNRSVLSEGPMSVGKRLLVPGVVPRLSIAAPDRLWFAGGFNGGGAYFANVAPALTGVGLLPIKSVFEPGGRIVNVSTPDGFLSALRKNPAMTVAGVQHVTVGGVDAIRATVTPHPKPPYASVCRGHPCVPISPFPNGTYVVLDGTTNEFTLVQRGSKLLLLGAELGSHPSAALVGRACRLIRSIRLER
jgi:hypothetical protein